MVAVLASLVTLVVLNAGKYGVFLTGGTTLNYNIIPSYDVSVTCWDHRRPGTTESLTVSLIRNEPPTIVNLPWSAETSKDTSTETLLYTVSVTDPTNDTVTCVLSSTVINDFFLQTGSSQYDIEIYTRNTVAFSYDTQKTYKLDVTCADTRRNVTSFLYVYLIRNMPPKFTNLQGKTTLSATSLSGSTVFVVTAEDDENDAIKYALSSSGSHPFNINQNTGEISLSRSIRTDYITGYDLSATINDGRNTTGPRTLTVLITDINFPPVITNLPMTMSVLEGVTVGTTLFQAQVDDEDVTDSHTFSVIYYPPDGAVYFAFNKTGTVLQNPYYQCRDEDGDTLKYTFNCGSDTGRFDMNTATGFFSYSTDYDLGMPGTSSLVQCKVFISDNEYTSTATVILTVTDTNDNTPVFQHEENTFLVSINTVVGTAIGQVSATDADVGNYGVLLYYIEQATSESSVFDVSSDGTMTTKPLLTSYNVGSKFNVTVYAIDMGGNENSTNVQIVIPDTTEASAVVDSTILYSTFFTYAPNMAWFVPAIIAVTIAVRAVIYTIATAECDYECPKRKENKPLRRRRRRNVNVSHL